MKPVRIRKEIEAFVADRLLEALWREALWLIKDGICTTQELDDIVRYGFGLDFAARRIDPGLVHGFIAEDCIWRPVLPVQRVVPPQ